MKKLLGSVFFSGAALVFAVQTASAQVPDWAYAIPLEAAPPVVDDGSQLGLPGSDRTFTRSQIRGRSPDNEDVRTPPADWYPGDHPQMPNIVSAGDNARGIVACSLCHYPNGKGRPENASPAGLARDYFIQTMHDFRNDLRGSAEERKNNTRAMINFAKNMTEEEIVEAADYFSSMPWTPWIEVVETETVPTTYIQGGMFLRHEGEKAGTEPIGNRIIETPVNTEHTEVLRDPRSGFIAYVPVGAVARGENLVRNGGNGKTLQCAICHGEDLHGIANVPAIAARSPSYIVRQLYDMQQGTRHGAMTALMGPVVANLTSEDMLNIAAYTASLPAH